MLLWKLLRQHISIPQLAGFFLANLIGITIILLGVQFYTDVSAIYQGEDSFMKADYLIVNKKIGTITSLTGKSTAFSPEEIDDIRQQSFVKAVGLFTPSTFSVRAAFEMDGIANMSTDMFFESVPDQFVDVTSQQWKYQPGSTDIPIILPKNYLDLYNFGYASSRGMPKLSEGILGAVSLRITVMTASRRQDFNGRIVGFSSRLNTILVPQSFMQWANVEFGSTPAEPTRLIMEVDNPTNPDITQFLRDNGYETDDSKLDASKTNFMLKVMVAVVTSVGLVISILALYILMLSIYLLVQKNASKLQNLLVIGYSPLQVSMPYQLLTVLLNILVLLLSFCILIPVRSIYLSLFLGFFPNLTPPSILPSLIISAILLTIVSLLNVLIIKSKILSLWNKHN